MFTLDDLDSRHFLVTWTLSCEKIMPVDLMEKFLVFRCTTNSVLKRNFSCFFIASHQLFPAGEQ